MESRKAVEKLCKQKAAGEQVEVDAEAKARKSKERVHQRRQYLAQLREQASSLENQIAESPEGLEQENLELQASLRQKRLLVEAKGDEKRSRALRDQTIARLQTHLEKYLDELQRFADAQTREAEARKRTQQARSELEALRQTLHLKSIESMEQEERIRHLSADIESDKKDFEEKERLLELRRRAALQQHEELQAKRTDEQRAYHAKQAERLELEAELANLRRTHEAQKADALAEQRRILDDAKAYSQTIDGLLRKASGGVGLGFNTTAEALPRPSPARTPLRSPARGRMRSPGRSLRRPLSTERPQIRPLGI